MGQQHKSNAWRGGGEAMDETKRKKKKRGGLFRRSLLEPIMEEEDVENCCLTAVKKIWRVCCTISLFNDPGWYG